MLKPHKHADIIKKWADGHIIQCKMGEIWFNVENPIWRENYEYRVKPNDYDINVKITFAVSDDLKNFGVVDFVETNYVKFVYDQDTKKLKSVKIIDEDEDGEETQTCQYHC